MHATPAHTTTFGALRQAVVKVPNADGIVAAGGGLWIKTDDGHAVRIDPATNKVTARVALDSVADPSSYCQGIGTDGVAVWACATEDEGTAVAQLDPTDGQVVQRVQVGKKFDQLSIPGTGRGMWVLTGDGENVTLVDPATGKTTGFHLGVDCEQLAVRGDRIVATASVANVVVELNAATGAVVGKVSLPSPRVAAVAGGDIWVDTSAGLTRLGPDLTTKAIYPDVVATGEGDVVAAAGSVWVRAADGAITRIDSNTGQLLERISPADPLTAGSLYVAYGSIWTTSSDDGRVVRLRLDRADPGVILH